MHAPSTSTSTSISSVGSSKTARFASFIAPLTTWLPTHLPRHFRPRKSNILRRNSGSYRFEGECWIWASKRDTRASNPSLRVLLISLYVFLRHFHSAVHTAPPRIHFSPFLIKGLFTSTFFYCSMPQLLLFLVEYGAVAHLFLFTFIRMIRSSSLSRLAPQRLR